jgi:peptide/nickel transport system permease protein
VSSVDLLRSRPPFSTTEAIARSAISRAQSIEAVGWPLWVVVGLLVIAVFDPVVAPYDPTHFDVAHALAGPSPTHPFGTDQFGRDEFSRMLVGSRSLVTLSVMATVATLILGVTWGLLAAYQGGVGDEVLMRAVDIIISVPPILISIMIIVVFGSNDLTLAVAVAIVFSPFVSRVVRSQGLVVIAQEYVSAARIAGESTAYILFREILPNMFTLVAVEAAMRFGFVVLLIAGLGFLGLGVQPPTPDWGYMLSDSRNYLQTAPWLVAFPALGIAAVVITSNALADALSGSRRVQHVRQNALAELAGTERVPER